MKITFEFATQDDCLDKMVPSDLRCVVSERDHAVKERDAALAQVEALRAALGNLHDIASRCDGWESFPQKALYAAADVLAATPQHHLRQVRAAAGRAGYLQGHLDAGGSASDWNKKHSEHHANQYYASILAGKE